MIDFLFSGRKSASGQNIKVFMEMAFGTKKKKALSALTFLSSPLFLLATAGKFALKRYITKDYALPTEFLKKFPGAAYNESKIDKLERAVYPIKKKLLPLPAKEYGFMKYRAPLRILRWLTRTAFGVPMKIKAEHNDAARLMDIDSWQDWSFMNSMMHRADDQMTFTLTGKKSRSLHSSNHILWKKV